MPNITTESTVSQLLEMFSWLECPKRMLATMGYSSLPQCFLISVTGTVLTTSNHRPATSGPVVVQVALWACSNWRFSQRRRCADCRRSGNIPNTPSNNPKSGNSW
ncbi:hypothetical protein PHET_02310 [Paragonimus heterotremus]|uniref:Uncharacterized protein n=1 Tax=Paragonimus heterotremus TaxID=100268 RepID=A0A8J4SSQ9_9TREM|nr:hypothetical protein PHET_02310 [Paragonimus heterotremus]